MRNSRRSFLKMAFALPTTWAFLNVDSTTAESDRDIKFHKPLIIFGSTKDSRLHVMHALGSRLSKFNPSARVIRVSARKYVNDCVTAIRRNEIFKFREKYQSCNLLMMEEIDLLGRGQIVQDELTQILRYHSGYKHSIIMTSNDPPNQIKGLKSQIVSCFNRGLVDLRS